MEDGENEGALVGGLDILYICFIMFWLVKLVTGSWSSSLPLHLSAVSSFYFILINFFDEPGCFAREAIFQEKKSFLHLLKFEGFMRVRMFFTSFVAKKRKKRI